MTSLSRSIPGAVALAVVLILGACGREAPEDADEARFDRGSVDSRTRP